jgi:mono/diheme cytochrome c family protein
MPNTRIVRQVGLLASFVVALALLAGHARPASAQEGAGGGQAASRTPPIQHPPGTRLTEQQTRGAGVFIQRCSLCHLAKTSGAGGSKFCCAPALAPNLSGRFANISPEQEQAYRDIILNGGPTVMPSWKYGLTPEEIDDIIAYLKTLS